MFEFNINTLILLSPSVFNLLFTRIINDINILRTITLI